MPTVIDFTVKTKVNDVHTSKVLSLPMILNLLFIVSILKLMFV